MLTRIAPSDVPRYRNAEKSPRAIFAEETLTNFLEMTSPGDVVEVSEMPSLLDDPVKNAQAIRQALRSEAWRLSRGSNSDLRDSFRAFCRGERLFIERVKPWREMQVEPRKRNPYPGDIPKV